MDMLETMLIEAGITFLGPSDFEERTPGRYFQKRQTDLGYGFRQFYVVLGPGVESPIHDHVGERLTETHLLLYGGGTFLLYDEDGKESGVMVLERGRFHPIFSTPDTTPRHKYVADPEMGSVTLALVHVLPGSE